MDHMRSHSPSGLAALTFVFGGIVMLAALVQPLGAQGVLTELVDERVRLKVRGDDEPVVGTLRFVGADSTRVILSSSLERQIATTEILGVERSLGHRSRVGRGVAVGATSGFLFGGLFGFAVGEGVCGSCDGTGGFALATAGLGLLSGGLMGGILGAIASGEGWEDVAVGDSGWVGSFAVAPGGGGLGLSIRLRPPAPARRGGLGGGQFPPGTTLAR